MEVKAIDFWSKELTDEEAEQLIEKAVSEIQKRKLITPAILFLEMHKPLGYIGSQAAIAFSPFIVPFVGFDFVNNYSRLFSKRENIEKLIVRLENAREEAPN
jgi:positive regulator of sigma E activity